MRCPSLRAMEKSLPFKCQKLKFSSDSTSINGVNYEIGVFNGMFARCLQLTRPHHLYQDKELQISCGDNHEEELSKDPNLWDDYMNFLKLEVIDDDSE
ncbi:Protein CBG26114 [Caenorhabditis briggsae]|uniref:Protein CBG26114 n=1 Tax=Caenorhabditis briggsae TaxID=6238 RepID=B6IM30_CAEBR|nr:Protein CBG26114 [Caenorhabditis briggsae]CAS00960.1 Protein CBG26114 [Caenorhabditis briggsae]